MKCNFTIVSVAFVLMTGLPAVGQVERGPAHQDREIIIERILERDQSPRPGQHQRIEIQKRRQGAMQPGGEHIRPRVQMRDRHGLPGQREFRGGPGGPQGRFMQRHRMQQQRGIGQRPHLRAHIRQRMLDHGRPFAGRGMIDRPQQFQLRRPMIRQRMNMQRGNRGGNISPMTRQQLHLHRQPQAGPQPHADSPRPQMRQRMAPQPGSRAPMRPRRPI